MAELHGLQIGVIRSPLTSPGMLLQALLLMWHQDSDMQSELLRLLREQVGFLGGFLSWDHRGEASTISNGFHLVDLDF